jgi:pilus assembly protein TadC
MIRWGWIVMGALAVGWRGALGTVVVVVGARLRHRVRRTPGLGDAEVDQVAALVVIGLSASMSLANALAAAAEECGGAAATEVADLLRRASHRGFARALAETSGPLGELTSQLAQAQVTGAPMVGAVTAFLATRRAAARARALERARTLPVKLIVPLALLLLPGFLILVMGPYIADQIGGLVGAGLP